MTQETNVPVSRRIDEICDAFEAALKTDAPPRIEDFLEQIDAEHRAALFRELFEIELERVTQPELTQKERQERYETRFPDYAEMIGSIFRRVMKPDRIGDYEIIEELGHGGMGVVYKGRQTHLGQAVAIKILPQALLDDTQAIARFRREMQLIGRLSHPNIVRALNAGELDGTHFLAMEYVDGVNLQQFVAQLSAQNERLSLGVVCEIIRQAALGLQHAHEYGLVHRDIKPANLMLEYSGTVKILDLGLGKFLSEKRSEDSHIMTKIGATMGTPDYMSPEQCRVAKDVDIRADIYSLGCTFCFLATGHPPYHEERFDTLDKKMMGQIVGEIPSLVDEIPETPGEVEEVFQTMLAKKPEQRFQTPLEIADALEPFADIDQLHELLESWKLEHGIDANGPLSARSQGRISSGRIGGRSTGRVSAKSTKKQIIRPKPERVLIPHFARDWRVIGTVVAVLILVAALLPFFKHKPSVPPELATQIKEAKLNLAQLPGLNGRWWFDEIPWFIPPVREQLLLQLDKNPELFGNDLDRYFHPNVAEVYDWLWSLTEQQLRDLTPPQRELVQELHTIVLSGKDSTESQVPLLAATQKFENAVGENARTAVDWHTLANLKHRYAVVGQNNDLAENSRKCYEIAKAKYAAMPTPQHSVPLASLCQGDALRIEYVCVANRKNRKSGDFDLLFEEFNKLCLADKTSPLSPLFEIEFRATYGANAAEAGSFFDAERQFKLAINALEKCKTDMMSHPLKAYITERNAWFLMDQWRVEEAGELFKRAERYRTNNYETVKNPHALIYVLHNQHGLAMTTRYLGDSVGAEQQYAMLQKNIDAAITNLEQNKQEVDPQFLTDLYERAGNTRERRADCILYSGAASGIGRERFADMAFLYEGASEHYRPVSMKRVMRLKQAIMLMLIGDREQMELGEKILNEVMAQEKAEPHNDPANLVRFRLISQLAEAVLALKKSEVEPKIDSDAATEGNAVPSRRESLATLYRFLNEFPYTTNSNPTPINENEAGRRENLEMWLFAAELLLTDLLAHNESRQASNDVLYLVSALGRLKKNSQSEQQLEPFTRRFNDLVRRVRTPEEQGQ